MRGRVRRRGGGYKSSIDPNQRLTPLRATSSARRTARRQPAARGQPREPTPPKYPAKPPGWTTASGRGADHQRERREALAAFTEGTPCPFGEGYCGHAPMYSWQELDLDEYPPRVIAEATGARQVRRLSHAACNRSAGARLGNALRKGKPRPPRRTPANDARRSRW